MKKFLLAFILVTAAYAAPRTFEMSGGTAVLPGEHHYRLGRAAFDQGKWQDAIFQFKACSDEFIDAHYYSGKAYYALRQWDFAEAEFSSYLEKSTAPEYFEEVLQYKYTIANHYREGVHKHLFGMKRFPKWVPAKEDALRIYDELATAVPSSEMAAQCLFAKGNLLWLLRRYQEGVEAYQSLIYRFPNHAYAPESYLSMAKLYLGWCKFQPQNPDIYPLAQVNLRRFRKEFPTDERLIEAEGLAGEMRERLAESMIEMAEFYERTKKPEAAKVYYKAAMQEYPATIAAKHSNEQLALLDE